MDEHKRTVVKSITWRVIATTTTIIAVYTYTNDWRIAATSGIVANVIKTALYYIHERLWNRSSFGVAKKGSKNHVRSRRGNKTKTRSR